MPTLRVHDLDIAYHHFPARAPTEPEPGPARRPVLCLPSTGLSGLQWRRLAKQLSKRGHAVWCLDFIGYGESDDWPRAKAPFRTSYEVDVVDALIDHQLRDQIGADAPPLHLVAHSYGGRVGLRAALRRPQLFASLALFEPTCFGVLRSTQDAAAQAELLDYDADGRFLDDEFGGTPAWVERFVDYWSGAGTWADLDEDEQARWLRSRRKMFEEVRETALDDVPHTRYVEALGARPTLVMSGAESTRAGRSCAEQLAAQLPGGRHVELDEVGHMAPVLAGREVAALIVEHIEQVERSQDR